MNARNRRRFRRATKRRPYDDSAVNINGGNPTKKANKIISILLVIAMLMSMAPLSLTASAESDTDSYVASVTDKDGNALEGSPYMTFAEAVTAAQSSSESKLTLLDGITLTSTQKITSGKFTLDLNGKTLKHQSGNTLLVNSGADLTVVDSGENGSIEATESKRAAIDCDGGTLTIESGYIYGRGYAIDAEANCKLTVNGGKLEGRLYSIYCVGGEVELNDGTFIGTVWIFSSYEINGGDYTATYIGVNAEGGTLTINGGTFNIQRLDLVKGNISLKGGEFPKGFTLNVSSLNSDGIKYVNDILAEDHYFYDEDGNKKTVASDATSISGYVQVKEYFAASVTDKDGNEIGKYKTLAEAVTAAQASEDSVLTLLDNVTLTEQQRIESGKFTLDLGGKTLKNESGDMLLINSGAELTVVDSGENGSIEATGSLNTAITNWGTLTVESGYIYGGYQAINTTTKLTVKDGKLEGGNYSVYCTSGEVELIDGTFIGNVFGFTGYEINGGDYTADCIGINAAGETLTVNGGTFNIDEIQVIKGNVSLNGGEFPEGFTLNDVNNDGDDKKYLSDILADGYAFFDENGSKITVADDATEISGYVQVKEYFAASVTDKDGNEIGKYKTFAEALTAAQANEDSVLTLLDSITFTSKQIIDSGKFILDLNGKTLLNESDVVLEIYSGVTLTIKDSDTGGTIESKASGYLSISNHGTLTVESGTVKGDGGIKNLSSGTLYFKNGTVDVVVYSPITNNGTAYVYDGVLKNEKGPGVLNYSGAELYIYDGEISGSKGIENSGTAYIEGGEIKGNSNAALDILGGTVEVTGGSFSGKDFASGYYTGTPYGEYTVSCSDGATLTLKGGEFPNGFVTVGATANTFLADGYAFFDENGSKITVADDATKIDGYVQVKEYFVASVIGKDGKEIGKYHTFSDAATAAKANANSTLKLLDNTDGCYVGVISPFTLDLNGYTLSMNDGDFDIGTDNLGYDCHLTVTDTSENKTGKITGSAVYGVFYVGYKGSFGKLTILNGTIEHNHKSQGAIVVAGKGTVKIKGGSVSSTGAEVFVGNSSSSSYAGSVDISGGTFPDGIKIVVNSSKSTSKENYLVDLLADGYFYRDEDGNIINVADGGTEISGYVQVTKGADFENEAVVTLSETEVTYNGEEQKPTVTVKIGGKALTENTHYTLTYANNTNSGTATVTVAGAGDYAGKEIVKTFEIKKADSSVATEPAANELTYNGSSQELITAGSTADGTMVYSLDGETYSETIPAGENAKEYTVYYKVLGDINHNDTEPETIVVTIKAMDISDATITLGDSLTYNGAEQTQEVAEVEIPAGLDVTYSISGNKATNVGVYQLTVTGTGNFEGEATATYEIAPDTSGIDALTVDNVKSSDKAAVEAVKAQIDNAVTDLADDETKAEYKAISDKCDELLAVIGATAGEIERIETAVNAYDEATVKSTDKANLEQLIVDIKALTNTDNITDDERTNLEALETTTDELIEKIDETTAEITRIETAVNAYDVSTVKSTDKADIEKLVADIKALTDGQNITVDERANLEALDSVCDELLAKIAETTAEYNRVIAAANGYDKSTVTSADKDALTQLNTDIYALALTDNVTSNEKTQLMTAHINVFSCIQKVTYVSEELQRIIEAVDKYVFESVKSSDKADIEKLIADIRTLLDGQNITADERTLLETADETCDKLIAKIDETVAEISRIDEATNAYDIETVTSADKADIEKLIADIKALTDGDNITETERAQLVADDETLNELLAKINATAEEIARIEEAVNAYDEATVKSTDKADLEQLVADIKALTDKTNITEDERTDLEALDATADSLIKKIDDTKAEIDRINEAVNGYDEETVTSADIPEISKLIEDINALTDGDNLTEEEETALEDKKAAINDFIEKLTEIAEEIKRVDEAVKSYDENTVKSTDSEDLAQLKDDVQALIDSTNTSENEKTALEEMINTIEGLEDKIAETEAQLEKIAGIENGYDPETVTSDNKAAIEEVIAEIDAVNPDNLTDEQKAEYEEIKAGFEALLEEIAAAENAVAEIGVELEMFDENRVTIFWEDDIEALKAKIDELLADENMGEAEKTKLNEYKAECDNLIEIIHTPVKYISLRFFYFIWDCLCWKWNGIVRIFKNLFA